MTHFVSASSVALMAGFVVAPTVARAACAVDADCPKGWVCDVSDGAACSVQGCARNDPNCSTEPVCGSVSDYECVPSTCSADADCGDAMTCYQYTSESCSDQEEDCADGDTCAATTPACTEITRSICLPTWILPCSADEDCGAGFTCVAQQSCECPSSSASPSDGAARADEAGGASSGGTATDPECVCTTSDTKQCEPVEEQQSCDVASDCPSGWTCEADSADEVDCTAVAPTAAGVPSDEPVCETSTPTKKVCLPPYQEFGGTGEAGAGGGEEDDTYAGDDDDDDAESAGSEESGTNAASDDDDDNDDNDAESAGGEESGTNAASDDDAIGAVGSSGDDDGVHGSSVELAENGCGCRVGLAPPSTAGLWLGVLGLIGLGLRRRHPV